MIVKRKILIAALLALAGFSGLFVWYAEKVYPASVERNVIKAIYALSGMPQDAELPVATQRGNVLVFNNVPLDTDGFNTIGALHVEFTPAYFFWKAGVNRIVISNPSITADFDEKQPLRNFVSVISGSFPSIFYIADTIEIIAGKADLLTHNFGGVRLGFDGQIRKAENGAKSVQMNLDAAQKQLSAQIRINATIQENGEWHVENAIEQARLDLDDMQLSRVSGSVIGDGLGNNFFIKGEYNIGALNYFGIVLDEVAVTYEQSDKVLSWVMAGKAQKSDGIEIGVHYNTTRPDRVFGSLYTQDIPTLAAFFSGDPLPPSAAIKETSEDDEVAGPPLSDLFLSFAFPAAYIMNAEKNVILNFDDIPLEDLFHVLGMNKAKAEGAIAGAVRFAFQDGRFKPATVSFKSDAGGRFTLPRTEARKALPRGAGKQADILKDYVYDSFLLSIQGDDLPGHAGIVLDMKGADGKDDIRIEWEDRDLSSLWKKLSTRE